MVRRGAAYVWIGSETQDACPAAHNGNQRFMRGSTFALLFRPIGRQGIREDMQNVQDIHRGTEKDPCVVLIKQEEKG